MSVKIKLRLPVPEGRPGDVVEVSNERAAALIDRRYAIHVSGGGDTAPSSYVEPAVAEDVAVETDSAVAPVTELPTVADKKEVWEAAAASLGINTDNMTKVEIIEAVGEATG